jgi:hypothetical protein
MITGAPSANQRPHLALREKIEIINFRSVWRASKASSPRSSYREIFSNGCFIEDLDILAHIVALKKQLSVWQRSITGVNGIVVGESKSR